jgi:Ran GTPase-activating protein (RanGAP) involved in mRNA processing and transport
MHLFMYLFIPMHVFNFILTCILYQLQCTTTTQQIDLSQRGLQPSDARLVKLALLQNSSLSVLKLGYNNLSDEGVVTLASGISNHTALTSLDLGFNNVGNEGCRALALAIVSAMKNGGKMHTLYLAGNRITQQGAHALAEVFLESKRYCGAHGLKRIHLTGNKVGPDGIRCLMEAIVVAEGNGNADMASNDDELSNHKMNDCDMLEQGIEELFLGGTGMGYMGCAAVAKMLETSRSLQVLSLSNCELDDNSALLIASSIAKNCQHLPLKRLELSFNNLTSKGVEALMNAVWGLKCLEDLQLDNNRMEGRGAQVVSAVLGGVKTLKKLDVGFNRITENGMKLLMKAVAENSSLCSLTISGNNIDTMGSAKAVAYALAHNKSLKSIFLDHCTIPRDGQRHITAGIVSNSGTSLEVLTGFPVGGKFSFATYHCILFACFP